MNDKQKIERLAKWMGEDAPDGYAPRIILGADGRYYIDIVVCAVSKDAESKYRVRIWNPRTNIADAWMLVEMAQHKWLDTDEEWNALDNIAEHVFALSGEEAAAWLDTDEEWNTLDNIAEHVFALSGEEAAAAISDAVLEVIA